MRLQYLILATLLSCLCIGCGEDPQTGNPAAPAPVAKENETPVASDTKSNPDVDSQKDSQTPPVTVANDGDPINGNELRDHRTDAKFEFPARFAAIQDEHFQLAKLEEAQKHLVLAISEQATFNEMPFPIDFRVVSKLKDDLYEIQNRTTGQNALLRTSKTEFKTTGLATLIVQKEDSLSLPMENGFERTFDVFRETLDDYGTAESRYFEMRKSIPEHQRQFWSLTHDSNVVPANSMEDLAEMYGVTVEQIAILWNSSVLENWKRTYDSNRHKDREK